MASVGRDFHHPYTPYEIQDQLMNAIYDCIAERKVGIFESPTGTGKSLSLICSSLTWLRDFQDGKLEEQIFLDPDDEEPSWVMEHAKIQRRNAIIEQKLELEERLTKIRNQELHQKQRYESGQPQLKRHKLSERENQADGAAEASFVLDDYTSDDEGSSQVNPIKGMLNQDGFSITSINLMQKLGMFAGPSLENEDVKPVDETKIFYCSRTHSQLTQFVHEIRRVKLRPAFWVAAPDQSLTRENPELPPVKHLPLGARNNLCINSKVSKLGNAVAINERCLELQKPSTPQDHKCIFLPTKENESLVHQFRDNTLAKIRDIEDLGSIGRKIGICPYYATRATVKPSEIITLPYPLLLQKSAREALDISLKDHVIIIDEAHNLMDAISNIHSITINQSQLKCCRTQLGIYLQKFRSRLKGKNRIYVTQVVRLLDSLSACLDNIAKNSKSSDGILNISEFLTGKGVDQINLYKLMRYLEESKLARKVEGYIKFTKEHESNPISRPHPSSLPVLIHIHSFLRTLTNPASEGRYFYEKQEGNECSIKYMLLDPTYHFREIVEEARAVILVGGTMSPMDDYVRHLFPYVNSDRLKLWSCGHIIPKDNLIVLSVAKRAKSLDFDFTFSNRNSPTTVDALGNSLLEISAAIPDGVVVFFPSYAYLDQVIIRWRNGAAQASTSLWDRLSEQKPVFQESKDANVTDDLLHEYTKAVDSGKGGLLLSVIGGKMSEGINFSDKLGRGVVVVGLPFPNVQSAQWKAKLEYIEKSTIRGGGSRDEGKIAGREFVENACMRAVNQSIGRAIRHQKDFASIILLDRRYRTERIESKLPGWIKQSVVHGKGDESFKDVISSLEVFFKAKCNGTNTS